MVELLYVGSLYYVNDNAKVDLVNIQIMHHIFYYKNSVIRKNPRIQVRKGLISYYKTNGIIFLKKNVDVNHYFITQMFEEKVNNLLKSTKERQPSKKRTNPFRGSIF
jgi:hypothetical protein